MSRDIYLLLLRMLHFTNNSTPHIHTDPIHKICIIIEKQYFSTVYSIQNTSFWNKIFLAMWLWKWLYTIFHYLYWGYYSDARQFLWCKSWKIWKYCTYVMISYMNISHCLYERIIDIQAPFYFHIYTEIIQMPVVMWKGHVIYE